jgi:peptidoglycan biosynthesis protein MviN/MurJ (putative lipid II flippase)
LVGVFLTGGLGILLTPSMKVNGLALALSCSTVGQFVLYLVLLRRLMKGRLGLRALVAPLGTMVVACIPAALLGLGVSTLGQWADGPTLPNIALLAGAGLGGGLLYAGAAMVLKVEEIHQVIDRVRRRIRR